MGWQSKARIGGYHPRMNWSRHDIGRARPARRATTALGVLALIGVLAGPAQAASGAGVNPSNGKWGGLQPSAACNRMPAVDTTENALPEGTCPDANLANNDEVVGFTLSGRHITAMSFDIEIQCLASDNDYWSGTVMSYRSASEFGYVGSNGSTSIPRNGRMRITFPVEQTVGYPAGTVQATFNFSGRRPQVAIYYKGRSAEVVDGQRSWTTCYSTMNHPSTIGVQKLGR